MLRVDHLSLGSKLVRDALQLRRVPRMAESSELEEVLVEEENHLEVILKHLPHLELAELAQLGAAVSQELHVQVIDLERLQRLATARPQDQGPWRSQLRDSQKIRAQCSKKGKGKGH